MLKDRIFWFAAADPNSSVETGNTFTFIFAYENIFWANSNQEHDPLLDRDTYRIKKCE